MFKRILFLPTVFFLILAVLVWTVPAAFGQQGLPLNPKTIPQFVNPLPLLTAANPGAFAIPYTMQTVDKQTGGAVTIRMCEFKANILQAGMALPTAPPTTYGGTWVWGYFPDPTGTSTCAQLIDLYDNGTANGSAGPLDTYIGPVILAGRSVLPANDRSLAVTWVNNLGTTVLTRLTFWKFSTDQTLHWADPIGAEANTCAKGTNSRIPSGLHNYYPFGDQCNLNYTGPIPAVVHLHGGEVPPGLDGGPDAWFTSDGSKTGHGYHTFAGAPVNGARYNYPNTQEAAPIWFHDHVLGITRLNVYAGLAGAYLIQDPTLVLPIGLHPYGLSYAAVQPPTLDVPTIPLVIQDRMFDTTGQLFFPADTAGGLLWSPNPDHPYWVPEFVGDTIVVNGKAWPFLSVEAKRYRLLFLNGSNARTYEVTLINQVTGANGPPMWVIGTDGGYLDAPAKIDPALGQKLLIMPGERYDVIIDFNGFANTTLLMRNTGRTPYPKGAPPQGSTVGRIIQFRVGAAPASDTSYNPATGPALRPLMVRLPGTPKGGAITPVTNVQKFRQLTLNEDLLPPITVAPDPVTGAAAGTAYPGGPVEILVNNTKWTGKFTTGDCRGDFYSVNPNQTYAQCYSELPKEGETELWEIINLTADAHPIHLHLVQFQIMNRQNFNFSKYNGLYNLAFTGTGPGGALPANCIANTYCPGYGPPLNYNGGGGTHPTYLQPILGGNPDVTPWLQGPAIPPALQEQGWKDTVVAMPGMVTRLMVRWAPTDLPATTAPSAAYFPFYPDGAHGYVWHCHIIDHEDNEMMRPTLVTPNPAFTGTRAYTNY